MLFKDLCLGLGEKPGLVVVREKDSRPRGRGFESSLILDVSDASYYISNEKKNNKGSQMGHTKKKYLKIRSNPGVLDSRDQSRSRFLDTLRITFLNC